MKKKICLVIFIVLFVGSILVNVKLLFFSPAVSLKNIPFEGVITEADSGKIVVKGDGTNGCGLTEHYQIYNSDQIKIVNTNDELIQFTDLKKGTRISMRLWIKEKTLYNDMDRLDIVTLIQCCEWKEDANEEKQKILDDVRYSDLYIGTAKYYMEDGKIRKYE